MARECGGFASNDVQLVKNPRVLAEKARCKAFFRVDLSDIPLTHRRDRIDGRSVDLRFTSATLNSGKWATLSTCPPEDSRMGRKLVQMSSHQGGSIAFSRRQERPSP